MEPCPCAPRFAAFRTTVVRDLLILGVCFTASVLVVFLGWHRWQSGTATAVGIGFALFCLFAAGTLGDHAPEHDCPPEVRPCPRIAFEAGVRREWVIFAIIVAACLAGAAIGAWVVGNGYVAMFSIIFLVVACAAGANIGGSAPQCSGGRMRAAA